VVFEPLELIEKLVALVPVPRGHLVRYHGVLAARARWRPLVVRDRRGEPGMPAEPTGKVEPSGKLRERRLSWADLMKRVFDHRIDCRPPRRSDRPGSHHPPFSSAVRARDRLRRAPIPVG